MRSRILAVLVVALSAAILAPVAMGAATKLSVTPRKVVAGEAVRVTGSGWPKRSTVLIYIRRPGSDQVKRLARVRTSRRGRFAKRIRISPAQAAGSWTILACRRQCRLKRARSLTVLEPSPYGGID